MGGGVPHKGPGHENVLECGAVLDLECGGGYTSVGIWQDL